MKVTDLVVGTHYAARLAGASETDWPVEVVFVARRGRNHAVVQVAGAEQVVYPSRDLLCRWAEVKSYLRDEELAGQLEQVNGDAGYTQVHNEVVNLIVEACTGRSLIPGSVYGTDPRWVDELWQRAGRPGSALEQHAASYTDRRGKWHVATETLLELAKGLAASDPEAVETYVDEMEPTYRDSPWWPEAKALVQRWIAGPLELRRLQGLVRRAAELLREAGDDAGADALAGELAGC